MILLLLLIFTNLHFICSCRECLSGQLVTDDPKLNIKSHFLNQPHYRTSYLYCSCRIVCLKAMLLTLRSILIMIPDQMRQEVLIVETLLVFSEVKGKLVYFPYLDFSIFYFFSCGYVLSVINI